MQIQIQPHRYHMLWDPIYGAVFVSAIFYPHSIIEFLLILYFLFFRMSTSAIRFSLLKISIIKNKRKNQTFVSRVVVRKIIKQRVGLNIQYFNVVAIIINIKPSQHYGTSSKYNSIKFSEKRWWKKGWKWIWRN